MNESFLILWLSIIAILIIRITIWMKIKKTLKTDDPAFEFFSTISVNTFIGIIPNVSKMDGKIRFIGRVFNK